MGAGGDFAGDWIVNGWYLFLINLPRVHGHRTILESEAEVKTHREAFPTNQFRKSPTPALVIMKYKYLLTSFLRGDGDRFGSFPEPDQIVVCNRELVLAKRNQVLDNLLRLARRVDRYLGCGK